MTQIIDIRYRDRVESNPINRRFKDITGSGVLTGFRFEKGTTPFTVNLIRSGYQSSVAISPSGARVEETEDLLNVLTFEPNSQTDTIRTDSVYMEYVYGTNTAVAGYVVVKGMSGSDAPSSNPNPSTHTLLGYVEVPANGVDISAANFAPVPYGFTKLNVAGPAHFYGPTNFIETVTFTKQVQLPDGTMITPEGPSGPIGGGSTLPAGVDRLDNPMKATAGQTRVTLPRSYIRDANALMVFVDWVYQPQTMYTEFDEYSFDFNEPLKGGEEIWVSWFSGIQLYQAAPHDHDSMYFRKDEILLRQPRFFEDFFNGMNGRTLVHNLGHTDYQIISVIATSKTNNLGEVSVEKFPNEIKVYNTGSYTGSFELTYMVKYP